MYLGSSKIDFFLQILAKIKTSRNENRYVGRNFEMVKLLFLFICLFMVVFIYGVAFLRKFLLGKVF